MLRSAVWAVVAIAIGTLNTLSLMGIPGLDPTNITWVSGDAATYYISWAAYRAETIWRWPITWTERLGYPLGISMSWFDPVPIMAILLRPFSSLLPATFQYFGIYMCIAFSLQAWFSLRLAARLFPGNIVFRLVTAILLVGSPIVTIRIKMVHYSVAGHWLMIACLYYYLQSTDRRSAARWLLPFAIIIFIAGGVNPYLGMICLILAGAGVMRLRLEGRATWMGAGVLSLLLLATLIGSYVSFGLLLPGMQTAYAITGFDYYSMNLLSPINPSPFRSIILPSLPFATAGQYEGYNYLGLGVIGLLVLNAIGRPRRFTATLRLTPRSIPLLALSVVCLVFAVSQRITLGPWTIAHIELPGVAQAFVSAIHCAGRFFWPVHYLIILLALVLTYRNWPSPTRELLLVGALVFQSADLLELRSQARSVYDLHTHDPLVSPIWRELRATHERLIVLPAWQCGVGSPGGGEGFRKFGLLAVAERLQTNSYYAARNSQEQIRVHCKEAASIDGRDLDPKAAYVVDDKIAAVWLAAGMRSHACNVVDGFNLCTHNTNGRSSSAEITQNVRALIPLSSSARP